MREEKHSSFFFERLWSTVVAQMQNDTEEDFAHHDFETKVF